MPKFPEFAERTRNVGGSVFEKFRPKMQQMGAKLVKLHIGDTYLAPPYSIPIDKRFTDNNEGFNRYCDTFGIRALREALSEKVNTDNQLFADPDQILMTCGATNALNTAVQTLVNPGEDVIILTPTWPFFKGMVTIAGGNVIEAPLYVRLYGDPQLDILGFLESRRTSKTVAIYLNTPNNPSGKVLNLEQLRQVADFAQKNRVWIISDEAYDGITYDDHDHISIGSLSGMYDQTVSIFTFSKVFMFSGLRLGYTVTDATTTRNLNKMMVHQLYSPATISQQMMVDPVKSRAEWRDQFVLHCNELRELVIANLKISPQAPEGSYYLFFSIKDHLNGRDYWEVIDECLENGISIAPGNDFGRDFHDYVRICFTGEKPERLEIAIDRLNEIFPV